MMTTTSGLLRATFSRSTTKTATSKNPLSSPTLAPAACEQYTCPDGTCSSTLSNCSCTAALVVSNVTAYINAVDVTAATGTPLTLGILLPLLASASASYTFPAAFLSANPLCTSYPYSSSLLQFKWALSNATSSSVASSSSASLSIANLQKILTIGGSYNLQLSVFSLRDGPLSPSVSLSWSVIAAAPAPLVSITGVLGTATRRSTAAALSITSTVQDLSGVNSSWFSWGCAVLSGSVCPSLSNATLASATIAAGSPAGTYNVTLTYRGSYSSSVLVTLVDEVVASVRVAISSTPAVSSSLTSGSGGLPVYLTSGAVFVTASAGVQGCTTATGSSVTVESVTWYLNEHLLPAADGGRSLTLNTTGAHRSLLNATALAGDSTMLAANTLRAEVNASLPGCGVATGTSSVQFAVLPELAVEMSASPSSGSSDSVAAVTGFAELSARFVLGAGSAAALPSWLVLDYTFGYVDDASSGRVMPLAAASTTESTSARRTVTVAAPLTSALSTGAVNVSAVAFVGSLRVNGVVVASSTASLNVTVASTAAVTTAVLQQAATVTDSGAALQLASSMTALMNGSSSTTAANSTEAASAVVGLASSMITMLNQTAASSVGSLDTTQQGSLLLVLSLTTTQLGALGNSSTDASQQLLEGAQTLMKTVLVLSLSSGTFDVAANGAVALGAITGVKAADVGALATTLANLAAQDASTPIGTSHSIEAGGVTITAVRHGADDLGSVNQSAGGGAASLAIPSTFSAAGLGLDGDSVVGIAITVFRDSGSNPFAGSSNSSNETSQPLSSSIASFEFTASSVSSGSAAVPLSVSNLETPLVISLKPTGNTSTLVCKYWDTAAGVWRNDGLTTTTLASGAVLCATTHLTAFSLVDNPASASPPSATPPVEGGGGRAALIGGVIGGGLGGALLGIIALVVHRQCKLQRERQNTHTAEEGESGAVSVAVSDPDAHRERHAEQLGGHQPYGQA